MDLHDATLHTITVRWKEREAELELTVIRHGSRTIKVRGLQLLSASRLDPWGPSDWIMGVDKESTVGGLDRVVLHMQSGDGIVIEADHIELP